MFDARIGFKSWSLFTTMTFLPNFKQPEIYILCPGGSLSGGGGLCPGGSLSKGGLCPGEGVSVQGGLCLGGGGLSPGGSLSKGGLCRGEVICPGGLCQGALPCEQNGKTGEKKHYLALNFVSIETDSMSARHSNSLNRFPLTVIVIIVISWSVFTKQL